MADGVISNRPRRLLRLAHRIEVSFNDRAECVDVGRGPHETREEFRTVYKRFAWLEKADGTRALVGTTLQARNRIALVLQALRDRVAAGTATEAEADAAQLPDAVTLDSTWDAAITAGAKADSGTS